MGRGEQEANARRWRFPCNPAEGWWE